MSKLSSVLKKTGIAVAAAAMLVTMGAGTVVTQAKTSLPVYKVSLAKKYTDHQKDKRMEASVKIPKAQETRNIHRAGQSDRYRRKSHEKRK